MYNPKPVRMFRDEQGRFTTSPLKNKGCNLVCEGDMFYSLYFNEWCKILKILPNRKFLFESVRHRFLFGIRKKYQAISDVTIDTIAKRYEIYRKI